jgi:predicted Zn-dependent peptidase
VGYKRPSHFDPDNAALDVLQIILSQGRTGMLYKELITDKHLAQSAQAASSFPGGRFPNIFLFVLVPAQGHTADELQRALDEFLNRLKQQRLDDNTMVRARAQARAMLMNRLGGNAGLAAMLGMYQGGYGDWRKLFLTVGEVNKVTADEIQTVLLKYFVPISRTTAYTVFPGQSGMTPATRPAPPAVTKPGDKQ